MKRWFFGELAFRLYQLMDLFGERTLLLRAAVWARKNEDALNRRHLLSR